MIFKLVLININKYDSTKTEISDFTKWFHMGSKFPYCNSYFIWKLRQISFNLGNGYTTYVTLP